jgi:putative transposase
MRHTQSTSGEDYGQPRWATWIADVLGITDYSAALSRTAVARCLLVASALRVAVSAVARRVTGCGRETVRHGIRASLPAEVRTLEGRLAGAFRQPLAGRHRRRRVPVAIDIHKRPYYGDRDRAPGVTGGPRDRGTSRFWSYATVVSLRRGHRHTLGLTTVRPKEKLAGVVERLLGHVRASGVRVRYVLLDRGFYAAEVFDLLNRQGLRFVIPVLRRPPSERFFRRGVRGWFEHTVESRRRECRATVRVAVVPNPDGRRGPLVFACSGGFDSGPRVLLRYRRRFGIESSYRQLGECLAQTTSRDRVYRLLLVGVSLLIRAWSIVAAVRVWEIRLQLILGIHTPHPTAAQAHTPPDRTTTL